jgi:hypothetical protein
MADTKNHDIGVGSLKKPVSKITPIFAISHLKTAATNNLLLVSTGKLTIISIGYCYQLISIMNLKCYNKPFFSSGSGVFIYRFPRCGLAAASLYSRFHAVGWREKQVAQGKLALLAVCVDNSLGCRVAKTGARENSCLNVGRTI